MSTFQELQQKLATAKYRKAILEYVVQHLDTDFRPTATTPAKKKLLTEDRREVPEEVFEAEVAFLLSDIKDLGEEIDQINASTFSVKKEEKPQPPAAADASAPPPEVKKKSKSKTESSTQGEVQ